MTDALCGTARMDHEADLFALELLMPEALVGPPIAEILRKYRIDDAAAFSVLAKKLQVDPFVLGVRVGQIIDRGFVK